MATSGTSICNQALGRIGANRINDLDDTTDTKPEAIQCRLHYEPTRDALLRSHWWRFAAGRATLSQDTVDPAFEYDHQFILPTDFMALRSIYGDNYTTRRNLRYSVAIEGSRILTDESTIQIRYTKKITDASKFDPLFVKMLSLLLSDELIGPLAGGDKGIQDKIDRKIASLMPRVRAMDRQEQNLVGRINQKSWNDARIQGGGTYRQDRV